MCSVPDPFVLVPTTPLPQSLFDLMDRTTSLHVGVDLSSLLISPIPGYSLAITPEQVPRQAANPLPKTPVEEQSHNQILTSPAEQSTSTSTLMPVWSSSMCLQTSLPALPNLDLTQVPVGALERTRPSRVASDALSERSAVELKQLLPELAVAFPGALVAEVKQRRGQKRSLPSTRTTFDVYSAIEQIDKSLSAHRATGQEYTAVELSDLVQSCEPFDSPMSVFCANRRTLLEPSSHLFANIVSGSALWHPVYHVAVRKVFQQKEADFARWIESESVRRPMRDGFVATFFETAKQACLASIVGNRLNRLRLFVPYFAFTYNTIPLLGSAIPSTLLARSIASSASTQPYAMIVEGVVRSDEMQLSCAIDSTGTSFVGATRSQESPSVLRVESIPKFLSDNVEHKNVRLNLYLMLAGAVLFAFRSCGVAFTHPLSLVDSDCCSVVVFDRACAFSYDSSPSAKVGATFFPRLCGFDKCQLLSDSSKVDCAVASPRYVLNPFFELLRLVDSELCDEMLRMVDLDSETQPIIGLLSRVVSFFVEKKSAVRSPTVTVSDPKKTIIRASGVASSSSCTLGRTNTCCYYESTQAVFNAVLDEEISKRVRLARCPASLPLRKLPCLADAVAQILKEFLLAHCVVLCVYEQSQSIANGVIELFDEFLSSASDSDEPQHKKLILLRRSSSLLFRYDDRLLAAISRMLSDVHIERVLSEQTTNVSLEQIYVSACDNVEPTVCFHSI